MDTFLGLFEPDREGEGEDTQLPPEPQLGNVEYKLKLVNPSRLRFQHLVTQMKWRLREGHGEAIYEIGVEDSGLLTGLSEEEMTASLETLEQMATTLGATTTVLRQRIVDDSRQVAQVLVRKVPDDQHNIEVRVAVMGSADAGKSTLLGVLTQGQLDNGRGRARLNMFRHLHEVQSGRTSSISHEILGFDQQGEVINYNEVMTSEEICERSSKLVTFMDLAGHRKYLRTTVQGLTGYWPHHVMLVVSGRAGVLGMTQEHLALALALDVPFFIVVTKTDLVAPTEAVLCLKGLLNAIGCSKTAMIVNDLDDVIEAGSSQMSENVVPIFCVSSVNGQGLDLLTRFLHVMPPGISLKEKERLEQERCEFQIDETFRVPEVGTVVGGLLTRGVITENTSLLIGPMDDGEFAQVTVQSIHRNRAPCRMVRASQSASLSIDAAPCPIRAGMVLVSPHEAQPPKGCFFFQATVSVLFHSTGTIYPGFQTTVHIGNVRQTAVMEGIMATSGIHTNQQASVLFRFVRHPEFVRVGARLLFRDGRTKGIGKECNKEQDVQSTISKGEEKRRDLLKKWKDEQKREKKLKKPFVSTGVYCFGRQNPAQHKFKVANSVKKLTVPIIPSFMDPSKRGKLALKSKAKTSAVLASKQKANTTYKKTVKGNPAPAEKRVTRAMTAAKGAVRKSAVSC